MISKFYDENKPILIFMLIVFGIIFLNNSGYFGINLSTQEIQFYNKPIILPFTLTNFTSPTIEAYFNDEGFVVDKDTKFRMPKLGINSLLKDYDVKQSEISLLMNSVRNYLVHFSIFQVRRNMRAEMK